MVVETRVRGVNTGAGNDLPHLLVPGEVRTFADNLYVLTYLHACTRVWSIHVEVRGELPRVSSVLLARGIHSSVLMRSQLGLTQNAEPIPG